jgi:hypothetical protein
MALSPAALGDNIADAHGPIGVMGEHTHHQGEVMFSYRYMRMEMSGNRVGTDSISPDEIVTTIPNVNAPPATLRVVPTDMSMDMHMFGAMWAPNDRVTLMAMLPYIEKEMDHTTYMGMAGTTELGTFTVKTDGFGDAKVSALFSLSHTETDRLVAGVGLTLPTGSIDETAAVLTPMNTTPTLRTPYAMQLGSGTYDPFGSITWARNTGTWGFGAQGSALLRLHDNDEDYHLGDEFKATAWTSYAFSPAASASLRLSGQSIGQIDGADAMIAAPVQTANPDFYGGERIDFGIGLNLIGQSGAIAGHRLAFEISTPIYEDLNGPQMETDLTATIGWQYAFGG